MFFYTSWHFYAFSGTNLLIRCHSASSYFLLFLYVKKVTQEIFSKLNEMKAKPPIFPDTKTKSKAETEEGQELATPWGGVGPPGYTTRWCGPLVHPLTSSFACIFSLRRKP
jgi:hypothetical protein